MRAWPWPRARLPGRPPGGVNVALAAISHPGGLLASLTAVRGAKAGEQLSWLHGPGLRVPGRRPGHHDERISEDMAKLKAALMLEGRDVLVDLAYRQNPRRGRPAAVREAMAKLGPEGRRAVTEAEQKIAGKEAKRRVRESAIRAAVTAKVRETLSAAAVPMQPGAGMAPAVPGGDGGGLMDALRPGRESPFWAVPGGAP